MTKSIGSVSKPRCRRGKDGPEEAGDHERFEIIVWFMAKRIHGHEHDNGHDHACNICDRNVGEASHPPQIQLAIHDGGDDEEENSEGKKIQE